jgi:glutathione S-transferase
MFYSFTDAPLGQLPYLTVDGLKLPQSSSIARFLANIFNLAGKDDLEKAKADVIIDTINDLLNQFYTAVYSVPEDQRVKHI